MGLYVSRLISIKNVIQLQVFTPKILYIIQVPTSALNNKITPTEQSRREYKVDPSTSGAGTRNNATINLKILSALF